MQSNIQLDTPPVISHPLLEALLTARLHDPFNYLGARAESDYSLVRAFYPYASRVWIDTGSAFAAMTRTHPVGVFEWRGVAMPPMPYLLRIEDSNAALPAPLIYETYDAYGFAPQIPEYDL
ncbi:MAG TPA: 1,4-alpha-glucan branching enzyme, partial [Gammaproteobacteria bacterium]|nr:1,4-alpha-glucan branching enzyme [Gammaproteobacteria bacterium]